MDKYANGTRCHDCYNAYMKVYMLKRYHDMRALGIELLGGKCVDCEQTDLLEFDHLNPEDKTYTISASKWSTTKAKFLAEVQKCVLRCKPCHILRTQQQNAPNFREGGCGERGTWRCPCTICKNARRMYHIDWRSRRS